MIMVLPVDRISRPAVLIWVFSALNTSGGGVAFIMAYMFANAVDRLPVNLFYASEDFQQLPITLESRRLNH